MLKNTNLQTVKAHIYRKRIARVRARRTGLAIATAFPCVTDNIYFNTPGGAPPTGVGGLNKLLRLMEPKICATSRSRRRIHPPVKSGPSA
jgi:hypothetical protein